MSQATQAREVLAREGFRQSQAWLHTWAGLLLVWLLYAIFLTGTVSYFKDELDHWMHPERHGLDAGAAPNWDNVLATLQEQAPANAPSWIVQLPDARNPTLQARWFGPGIPFGRMTLDPASGAQLKEADTQGGEFFYRFHFQLWHLDALTGRIIVGIATMFMFVAIISGIVTHKKIFKDFFTFRPRKGQRSWLDGHNVVSVLALPLHLMITYSGLVIFILIYLPWAVQFEYGKDRELLFDEVFPHAHGEPRSGTSAPMPDLAALIRQAEAHWGDGSRVGSLTLFTPGDSAARVEMRRDRSASISGVGGGLLLDASDGRVLEEVGQLKPAAQFNRTLVGLHLGHFAAPLLRWLYFLCGLGGCVMIASGAVLWLVKRAPPPAKAGAKTPFGHRLVQVLNVAAIAGLPLAMAAYLWANRLLAAGLEGRAAWEIHVFFAVWGLTLVHAALRPHRRAWVEQWAGVALLLCLLPLFELVMGRWPLPGGLAYGDWLVAGFDAGLLGLGLLCAWLSWKIHNHRPAVRPARAPRPEKAAPTSRAETRSEARTETRPETQADALETRG
ncbi:MULTISPECIES: PepSY-associated TM helix domain-containing protein [unclassified Pseudomonas]|uniref:PepSY-associated TM helix domain-containing protein n=1 Tax=unclassified Pseudomonas TaxID=196821 RepID=UPI00244BDF45|nr:MULTISPECIES: PepSY-associated TM helix domain-containing protein [unclassified Pseudomonas]MDG9929120.1 PepSY domain-containing protein [Pseudomonas sp. GD04042]MDH0484098.1 PepSY domain-containing protein [Pseudomonas sp. GD04015]MDH0605906.1 PepSY domain-containing protein [Pseudomonas sp. GD03869]